MRNTEINFPELQSGSANLSYIMDFSLYIKKHRTKLRYCTVFVVILIWQSEFAGTP